jgi:hypothetical protein
MIIINNLLSDFDLFRYHAITREYKGEVNPADGVLYPDISADIPEPVKAEIKDQLEHLLQSEIKINLMFMRLMTCHTSTPPHQAHNDSIMGQFTGILYINPGPGGTAIVDHKDVALMYGPSTEDEIRIWERDTNNYEQWKIIDMCHVEPNRMVVFPSHVMHRAEPVTGFGDCPENGRLVLTVFFNAV